MNWKYWVMRNENPARVKNPTVMDPLAAVKRGLRKSRTSSIGWAVRRSVLMNSASNRSPATSVATVDVEAQPQLGAWMIPNTSVPMAALESPKPAKSRAGTAGSFEDGTRNATSPDTTAATRTMKRNTLPHQNSSNSQPPTIGPPATPMPVVAPQNPIALPRRARSVNTLALMDNDE